MDTTLSAPIGQLLDGRYLVESQIARGGMATVYHARDVRLERIVALKIAHPELARDQEFVARFISEARSAARLSNPHVVAVFDQGSTGDLHYIAMEYVPGPTLRELLVARGRLSPREALDIIERVLAGLAAAHDAGIIHRDVKPENVLLGTGTSVKVADFGLARAAAGIRNTKTGMLIGTAAYLAPEQVASSSSDERTDVYAAGVMLFEMLTGVQPHTGDSPLAVAYKHVNTAVPPPSSINPDLPAALDTLVALGTSRDPDLRPPDARHYLKAITEVRRGLPLPPVTRREPAQAAATSNGHGQRQLAGAVDSDQSQAGQIRADQPGSGQASADTGPIRTGAAAAPYSAAPYSTAAYPDISGQPSANHTMIVPAGLDDDYANGSGYTARTPRRRSRGYREPIFQRWLFSRRILIVLGVLVVAGLVWWMTEGQYFTLPAVTGMTVSTARADLANVGLVAVSGAARHSDTVPAGEVISTSPAAGARTRHGAKIILIRSLGPVTVVVPSVTGEQLAQANQALKTAGLIPAPPTYQPSSSIPQGIVIATDPVAYKHWPKDKPVHLVVSAGPPLPNFVGMLLSAAQGAASAGGYNINQVTVAKSSQPSGTIVRQSPAANTPITPGEVVTVWVSPGPAQVNVPDVTGETINQAEHDLTAAGFNVTINQIGPGHRVITYSPTGTAPQGSTITITVGFGF
jgi:beta-lactam-binding protein with PASTA domain/tRNA A-37 threonylcarbamoyl transferase component Bud32